MHSVADGRPIAASYPEKTLPKSNLCASPSHPEEARKGAPLRAARAEGRGLGTTAKYSAAFDQVDPETGEIIPAETAYNPVAARIERFALQSAARRLLPNSRTAFCLRNVQKSKGVEVWQSKEHGTCSYKGLQTCGSVWACPCCAAKISERRRVELRSAIALHVAAGGQVLLATFTTPHTRHDVLADVLAAQAKALNSLNTDRASRAVFDGMGCVGKIRALEVTNGRLRRLNNGWHPHYHILLFVRSGVDLKAARAALYVRWHAACLKAGLGAPSVAHGVQLDDGSKAAAYASKWGLESEMTKGHTKKATDGETPFDLLRAFLASGDKHAGNLFREFAETFKGKRQLHWSKGLKKMFGIGDCSDEELAAVQDQQASLLGSLDLDDWRKVLAVDGRATLLELATHGGWDAVRLFIDSLPSRPHHESC